MPVKRRRIAPARVGVLLDTWRFHLICGFYFFDRGPEDRFDDDDHRRAVWAEYRDPILAEWDRPGERPHALWGYDYRLERVPLREPPTEATEWVWRWPDGARSEAEMVLRELRAGRLAPCVPGEAELLERRLEAARRARR